MNSCLHDSVQVQSGKSLSFPRSLLVGELSGLLSANSDWSKQSMETLNFHLLMITLKILKICWYVKSGTSLISLFNVSCAAPSVQL